MDISISTLREYDKMSPFEIKDKLIDLAGENARKNAATMLNAGRGNPNWVATTPREAFFALGHFAITESKRVFDIPDLGGMPNKSGIADRLKSWINKNYDMPGAEFLKHMLEFGTSRFKFNPDDFIHELTDSVIGDNYPVPDRILKHVETIVHEYLMWALCNDKPPKGKYDLFATEGGTAAMFYVFNSLFENKILRKGDTIALGTPIFTPYLEIPKLKDYQLNIVDIRASEDKQFQILDKEIAKLENPKIKIFFLINPSNPPSFAMNKKAMDKLVKLVKTKRKDLIILTDDVYGTFIPGFRSVLAELPQNTIGVYSYSKYFGATGWRLGAIALHQNHIIDNLIEKLSKSERSELRERYSTISLTPDKIKFIDRLVADSRAVALNHTAGLSLPQQTQMALFSLFQLMDKKNTYQASCMKIVHNRVKSAVEGLGVNPWTSPDYAAYYGIVDLEMGIRKFAGDDVFEFVKKHYHPLDIVFRLAEDHSIVLLNGSGFDGPEWSARISFANLPDDAYGKIGQALRAVAKTYIEAYKFSKNGKK